MVIIMFWWGLLGVCLLAYFVGGPYPEILGLKFSSAPWCQVQNFRQKIRCVITAGKIREGRMSAQAGFDES